MTGPKFSVNEIVLELHERDTPTVRTIVAIQHCEFAELVNNLHPNSNSPAGWYYYLLGDPRGIWTEESALRKLRPDDDSQEWEEFESKLDLGNPSPIKTTETEEIA